MAYRRNLATRAEHYCKQKFRLSFAYAHREDVDRSKISRSGFIGSRSNSLLGFGEISRNRWCSQTIFPSLRHMSTSTGENVRDMLNEMKDALDLQAMETVESAIASQAPAVSEVAVAAADSCFPSVAFQNLIDAVHSFTGLNWWASIALTTILVRVITTPLLINHIKDKKKWGAVFEFYVWPLARTNYKVLKSVRENELLNQTFDCARKNMSLLMKRSEELNTAGVTPRTVIFAPVSHVCVFLTAFFAIKNMVENVPSLKSGGPFLFTDLTTSDSSYMLPVLTAITYWMSFGGYKQTSLVTDIKKMCHLTEKDIDNMILYDDMKTTLNVMMKVTNWTVVVLIMPISMNFPKAYFCVWITSNLYTFIFRLAMESAWAKQLFGLNYKVKLPGSGRL